MVIPSNEKAKVVEEFTKYVGQLKRKYIIDTKDMDKTYKSTGINTWVEQVERDTITAPKDYDEYVQAQLYSGGTIVERLKWLDLLDTQVLQTEFGSEL